MAGRTWLPASLDYRCHLDDPSGDIPIHDKPKLQQCLQQLSGMEVQRIKTKYGIANDKAATLLRQRAVDLKAHGFAKALEMAMVRPASPPPWRHSSGARTLVLRVGL
jgi:hypothetical protein